MAALQCAAAACQNAGMAPHRLLRVGGRMAGVAAAGMLLVPSDSNPLRMLFRWLEPEGHFNRSRTGAEVTALCAKLKLPPPELAQHMPPIQLQGFLQPAEVSALVEAARGARDSLKVGIINRDATGDSGRQAAGAGVWRTSYLHTDNWFETHLPELAQKIREGAMQAVLRPENARLAAYVRQHPAHELNYRTVELHEYGAGGNLSDHQHYDAGSLLTIDVMLSQRGAGGDFDGGQFQCPVHDAGGGAAADAATATVGVDTKQPAQGSTVVIDDGFAAPGDVLVFPSHKYHNVLPVTRGQRTVMVLELWNGPRKQCAHRCLDNTEAPCEYTLQRSQLGNFSANVAMLG